MRQTSKELDKQLKSEERAIRKVNKSELRKSKKAQGKKSLKRLRKAEESRSLNEEYLQKIRQLTRTDIKSFPQKRYKMK